MNIKIDKKTIKALENLITVAEEQYSSRRIVTADDVIVIDSVALVRKFIQSAGMAER
tara:strand:+ start:943 stop:1113 length:171 start_codon:yes stop_codon:yes gene_type:complete